MFDGNRQGSLPQELVWLSTLVGRPADLEHIVGIPSAWHPDAPDDGCPSAALLDEIGRSTDAIKQAYTETNGPTPFAFCCPHPTGANLSREQHRRAMWG